MGSPLSLAVCAQQADVVQRLCLDGATGEGSIVHKAMEYFHVTTWTVLKHSGIVERFCDSLSADNLAPLHVAVQRGHGHMVEELLKCRADINVQGDLTWTKKLKFMLKTNLTVLLNDG